MAKKAGKGVAATSKQTMPKQTTNKPFTKEDKKTLKESGLLKLSRELIVGISRHLTVTQLGNLRCSCMSSIQSPSGE